MKAGGRPPALSNRFKLLFLFAGPMLVVALFTVAPWAGWLMERDPDTAPLAREMERAFADLTQQAAAIAEAALESSTPGALELASRGAWADRLEGVGVLDGKGSFTTWEGTPSEPDSLARDGAPRWVVRQQGVRSRLVVRVGPNPAGRQALATFVLASEVDGWSVAGLLPRGLSENIDIEVDLALSDTHDAAADEESAPDHVALLRAPTGELLARATLRPLPFEQRRARLRDAGRAWGLLAFAVLAWVLVRWREVSPRLGGVIGIAALLAFGRGLFVLWRVPATLLPRELASASAYGSTAAGRWLASPTDLLLTALVVYLLCRAWRRYCWTLAGSRRRLATVLTCGAAGMASAFAFALTLSLARDSALPLLDRRALLTADARPLLLIGLVLVLVGAAELWGLGFTLFKGSRLDHRPGGGIPAAVALIVLALICGFVLQAEQQTIAIERLRTELVPLTLEQKARRTVALTEALRDVASYFGEGEQLPDRSLEYLAYRFWVVGELFHSGYKSSLSFYSPDGMLLSRFAFDLPPLDEVIDTRLPDVPPERIELREESFPEAAVEQFLIHAQVPVLRDGELLGVVVGHVLDEPSNLPFLPGSQPYLAALGAGTPRPMVDEAQYIRYDEYGAVLLSTLSQPPAQTELLRAAAESGSAVRVRTGNDRYRGLAIGDRRQMHLLLVSERGPLEKLAASVRLALAGIVLLVLLGVMPRLLRRGGLEASILGLRRSFHRKLLAVMLLASVLPLVGLAWLVTGTIERRGDAELVQAANHYVSVAQRVLEDYAATQSEPGVEYGDEILYWLRRVVGQEIHVYSDGLLQASSKRELFDSGLLPLRLAGEVQRRLVDEGLPYLVVPETIGRSTLLVAYAPLRSEDPHRQLVVALPIVLDEQQEIARAVDRVAELILLATVLFVALLALVTAYFARTVARPVRELVDATGRIAAGDYGTRLEPRTRDEIADLVGGFNSMAASLAGQRADLEHRREYMESLLTHATTGVISTDAGGRIVTLNPAARKLLGPTGTLGIGVDLGRALSAVHELKPLAEALSGERARRTDPQEIDLERDHRRQRYRLVQIELEDPTHHSAGALILLDDVTELMRSNQLEAWAEMARAIGHEIKNPLTPIQLSTEHLTRLLRDRGVLPSREIDACLETVIKQVRSLREIAGEFSMYSKLPDLTPETADPASLMRIVIGPYRAGRPDGVTIEEDYQPTGPISVDSKVMTRALVNLVENALQAMPDGGTLTFSVEPAGDNREVVLSVRDTGTGLAPEVKRRLFEPYFSTKSSGTGLGLAIVRQAVEAHHGRIEVDSELSRGTTIRIVLPTLDRERVPSNPSRGPAGH